MQQKNIIIFLIIIFLASSTWLFFRSNIILDLNHQKNWWAIYFVEPKSNNLKFKIENHSDQNNFHWKVIIDKKIVLEKDEMVKKGETINLEPEITIELQNKKVNIQVFSGEEKREIYKNL